MVGSFIREIKIINDIRKELSEITEGLDDYYSANELLNELEDSRIRQFQEKCLNELPEIYR